MSDVDRYIDPETRELLRDISRSRAAKRIEPIGIDLDKIEVDIHYDREDRSYRVSIGRSSTPGYTYMWVYEHPWRLKDKRIAKKYTLEQRLERAAKHVVEVFRKKIVAEKERQEMIHRVACKALPQPCIERLERELGMLPEEGGNAEIHVENRFGDHFDVLAEHSSISRINDHTEDRSTT